MAGMWGSQVAGCAVANITASGARWNFLAQSARQRTVEGEVEAKRCAGGFVPPGGNEVCGALIAMFSQARELKVTRRRR